MQPRTERIPGAPASLKRTRLPGARVKTRGRAIVREIEQLEDFRLGQAVQAGEVPLGPRSRPSGLRDQPKR